MKVTDFDYDLPEELIAQHHVEPVSYTHLIRIATMYTRLH